ncbi:MAG: adenylate/guanylate cyclase domain-containing protein, partial [Bradyrhizobiaceae bacterium]|nr:adenylate/guanylate cyclase domain-containing protein [Bradyrhizobiaceae bacterium]
MKRLLDWGRRAGSGRTWGASLLCFLLFLRVVDPAPIEELRLRVFDFFQLLGPRVPTQRPAVIVDIDDASLFRLGQWAWPRTRVADLIAELARLGALVIAFDVVFSEPDRSSPQVAAEFFRGLDAETLNKLRELPNNDALMAESMGATKVILGESGLPSSAPPPDVAAVPYGVAALGADPKPFLVGFPGLLRNISVLERAAAGHGLFSIRPERDGIVRRVPIVMLAENRIVPSLAFEVLRVVSGSSTMLIRVDSAGIEGVRIPGFEVPTDSHGQVWVHFARHDRALYVSAADVLDHRVPAEKISGKLVFVGTSAVGLSDLKTTPIDAAMPGVEVHTQLIENILTNAMLISPNYALPLELVIATILSIITIVVVPRLGARHLFLFGATFYVLLPAASWFAFAHDQLLIDFTFPLLSTTLVFLLLTFANYLREQTERQRVRSAFAQYLSPVLVEQLAQTPGKLVLGGERRDMTILFSDMRGFTTIAESFKDDPQGLTALMNGFLTPLTNAIIDHYGTIDKYMGDAIMAFWNAPLYDSSHEIHACDGALDMLDRLERLNHEYMQQAKASGTIFHPLEIGIGINTGPCVVGNLGSDLRFDYSVLGDSVNLASRLQGQCRLYGVPIIVGQTTARALADRFAVAQLDFITVRGKAEAQLIYAIVGGRDVATSVSFKQWHDIHAEVLTHYRQRQWELAISAIERSQAADTA